MTQRLFSLNRYQVVSCWNYCVEGSEMRTVIMGAAVCGRCVEDRCFEAHSVRGCGDGGSCEGRVHVTNVVSGVFVGTG